MKNTFLVSVLLAVSLAFAAGAAAGDSLADRHAKVGVKCARCHVEKAPSKAPKMGACLKCHGGSYEALGKASAGKKPNPHYTHIGDKECTACHKGHKVSEFFCNDCHKFNMQVP